MNRGVLQSSPVQQLMAAGSPNWWNINNTRPVVSPPPVSPPFLPPPPSSFFPQYAPQPPPPPPSAWNDDNNQELPESWSQLLMGGLVVDQEDKSSLSPALKLENWEEQLMLHHHQQQQAALGSINSFDVKQENSTNGYHMFGSHNNNINAELIQAAAAAAAAAKPTWPHRMMPVSSPKSCVTSNLSSNMLDFSNSKPDGSRHPPHDRSSECNSTATGGAVKKARVQPSSTQTTFKVRKEKLGDRITALHQMVSPFGKTDTASVLLEAIGYIRFLQSQIEALSLPYLGSGSGNNMRQHQQQSVQGERNCLFPEDPGQLLNDNKYCLKRKVAPEDQESNTREAKTKDLKSRGLCLVPISCTVQVGSDNGADYWGPAALGGSSGGFQ